MSALMKIALTQQETAWEDPAANMRACARLAEDAARAGAALVVFPEFTLTGFTPRPRAFADAPGAAPQLDFFRALSRRLPLGLAFGCIRAAEPDAPQNRLVVVRNGTVLLDYAKLHSYSFGGETRAYSRGADLFTTAFEGFTLGGLICYDLRFPELFRTLALQGVELLLLPAQWPAARRYHWETLTAARAIENQFFLAACNSCGTAGETVFGGASRILGPRGELLAAAGAGEEIVTAALDFSVLAEVRNSINVFHDRRPELYRL